MTDSSAERPDSGEYDPFCETYVGRLGFGPVLSVLTTQGQTLRDLMSGLVHGGGDYRYASGKWSVKEVLGHLSDSERIFGMRATCIARGEVEDLPGFE
ncbi:MAG: DinB family protein, partial [Gemmatimonadales bacterium]